MKSAKGVIVRKFTQDEMTIFMDDDRVVIFIGVAPSTPENRNRALSVIEGPDFAPRLPVGSQQGGDTARVARRACRLSLDKFACFGEHIQNVKGPANTRSSGKDIFARRIDQAVIYCGRYHREKGLARGIISDFDLRIMPFKRSADNTEVDAAASAAVIDGQKGEITIFIRRDRDWKRYKAVNCDNLNHGISDGFLCQSACKTVFIKELVFVLGGTGKAQVGRTLVRTDDAHGHGAADTPRGRRDAGYADTDSLHKTIGINRCD